MVALIYLIRELAERDLFFTLVREGRAKLVMGAGGKGFERVIFTFRNYWMKVPGKHDYSDGKLSNWDIVHISDERLNVPFSNWLYKNLENVQYKFSRLIGLYGVHWLGIPGLHTTYKYTFRWNSLVQSKLNDKIVETDGGIYFHPHEERIDYILLQPDIYYARIEGAEDKNMVPLSLDTTFRIRAFNPQKALMEVQDWLEMIWGLYLPEVRVYVANRQWDILNKHRHQEAVKLQKEKRELVEYIFDHYGVRVEEFMFLRVGPYGKLKEEYEKAATSPYMAAKAAKVVAINAKAEKGRIAEVYGEIQRQGETGELIRRLEAVENAAKGQGNFVITAPELTEVTKSILKKGEQT